MTNRLASLVPAALLTAALLAIVSLFFWLFPTPPPAMVDVPLIVETFTNATVLTQPDATQLLTDANSRLQTSTYSYDVACNANLTIVPPISDAPLPHASWIDVNSPEAFDAQFADLPEPLLPSTRQVRVVSSISWCGVSKDVLGCSMDHRIVVIRVDPTIEGLLWAHETGHTKGLFHRYDLSSAIMNPYIYDSDRSLNNAECTAYRTVY